MDLGKTRFPSIPANHSLIGALVDSRDDCLRLGRVGAFRLCKTSIGSVLSM